MAPILAHCAFFSYHSLHGLHWANSNFRAALPHSRLPRLPCRNPRQHTGKGYFETAELERRELQRQIAAEEQKCAAEQEAARRKAAGEEELSRKAAQEGVKHIVAAEAGDAKFQAEAAERERKRQRGLGLWIRIDDPYRDSLINNFSGNTKSFAIAKDGYIIVNDNGGIAQCGIPDELDKRLTGRRGQPTAPPPVLVALGSGPSRYYIQFANGREWHGGFGMRSFSARIPKFTGVERGRVRVIGRLLGCAARRGRGLGRCDPRLAEGGTGQADPEQYRVPVHGPR